MDSILTSIKNLLGIVEEDDSFDIAIIVHINTVFMILNQLGVGPKECFSISDSTSVWTDFVPSNQVEAVKTFIYLKVKLVFDPPLNSAGIEAIERTLKELEWRLNVAVDPAE